MKNLMRVIAGSGRSGTTWVLDAVAHANHLRTVFEPLHPKAVCQARPFADRYIPPDRDYPELRAFLERVNAGAFHSIWSDYRIRPDRLMPGPAILESFDSAKVYFRRWRKLLRNYRYYRRFVREAGQVVKFIRANLMLGWIQRNFDARIVLLVRHPGAVIESQLRGGRDWSPTSILSRYMNDELLMREHASRYGVLLGQQLTVVEALTLLWCMQNQIPLDDAASNGYIVVFYEQLRRSPESEWRRAVAGLGLTEVPDAGLINRPSQQATSLWPAGMGKNDSGTEWMNRLGTARLKEVNRVLTAVGVDIYDAFNPEPRVPSPPA